MFGIPDQATSPMQGSDPFAQSPMMQGLMGGSQTPQQSGPTPLDAILNQLKMGQSKLGLQPMQLPQQPPPQPQSTMPPPAPTNNGAYSGPLSTLYSNPPQLPQQHYGLPVMPYPTQQAPQSGMYSGGVSGGGIGQNPGWGRPMLPLQQQNPGFSSSASPSMMSGMMGRPSNGI